MDNIFLDGKLLVTVGDITDQNVDAIVNATNSNLLGGSESDARMFIKHQIFSG